MTSLINTCLLYVSMFIIYVTPDIRDNFSHLSTKYEKLLIKLFKGLHYLFYDFKKYLIKNKLKLSESIFFIFSLLRLLIKR